MGTRESTPDLLTLTNNLLLVIDDHDVAYLGNAQHVRQVIALLAQVIKSGDQVVQTVAENVTAEQLIQRRLRREIIHLAGNIDEIIRQLSFEASFNLAVSVEPKSQLGSLMASLRQTASELQKNLFVSHQ